MPRFLESAYGYAISTRISDSSSGQSEDHVRRNRSMLWDLGNGTLENLAADQEVQSGASLSCEQCTCCDQCSATVGDNERGMRFCIRIVR